MTDIHLYNRYHLGDQLLNIHFLSKYLKQHPEFRFYNYMLPQYIEEANLHRHPEVEGRIINRPLSEAPATAQDSWINREGFYEKRIISAGKYGFMDYDTFYLEFYKYLFGILNTPIPEWNIEDTLLDHPIIMDTSEKREFDFLIVNSDTRSGQWPYDPESWNTLIRDLKGKGYKVVTTQKSAFNSVPSTLEDFGMTLLELGRLAGNCRYVIGNHTAPWAFALTKRSIENLEFLICMHVRGISYSPKNVYPVRNSMKEVYDILTREGLI